MARYILRQTGNEIQRILDNAESIENKSNIIDDSEIKYPTNSAVKKYVDESVPSDYEQIKIQVTNNTEDINELGRSKQDKINDLELIREGAARGANSVQDVVLNGTSVVVENIANLTDIVQQDLSSVFIGTPNPVNADTLGGDLTKQAILEKAAQLSELAIEMTGAHTSYDGKVYISLKARLDAEASKFGFFVDSHGYLCQRLKGED